MPQIDWSWHTNLGLQCVFVLKIVHAVSNGLWETLPGKKYKIKCCSKNIINHTSVVIRIYIIISIVHYIFLFQSNNAWARIISIYYTTMWSNIMVCSIQKRSIVPIRSLILKPSCLYFCIQPMSWIKHRDICIIYRNTKFHVSSISGVDDAKKDFMMMISWGLWCIILYFWGAVDILNEMLRRCLAKQV